MPRLFIAIDIPAPIKEELARLARELPVARWVPADQLHLTLRFIGDVGPETFTAIKNALSGLCFPGFPLTLVGTGHFPPGKRPRVLWIGVGSNPTLMALQQELELALIGPGIAPDERPFSPHLTLARLKETVPVAVRTFELRHAELAFPPFQVREAVLYSSVLTNQGAVHSRELGLPCQD
jgi:RNA 2',3'-cyclic 3'-phosphodiesterase